MSLSKLVTAFKGMFNSGVEAAVDSQAITILEQEIRETRDALQKSDHARTQILAKKKLAQGKVDSLVADIEKYESAAVKHAESDRALALECAQKAADLGAQLAAEREILQNFSQSEATLAGNIAKAKTNLKRLEQQVDVVKATDAVQTAQVAASSSFTGSNAKMKTALDSLDRVQAKQKQRAAELEAAEEIAQAESGADLDARLNAAGGPKNAEDALAALLSKNKA